MTKKNQHVVTTADGHWGVRGEGNSKLTKITPTQSEAIEIATEIAKKQRAEVVIHGRDGKIRDKDSYGPDSCPPADKKH